MKQLAKGPKWIGGFVMTVDMNTRFDKELITRLSRSKNEPDWLLDLRLKAFDHYRDLPIPHLEKTKIDHWNIDQFTLAGEDEKEQEQLPAEITSIVASKSEDRNLFVQKNGSTIYKEFSKNLADSGVIFTDLNYAVQEYPDLVKKYLMNSLSLDENKLIALHAALWKGGIFLYIPRNTNVEVPIQAVHLASDQGLLPHILIIAERNSSVTYVDHRFSLENKQTTVHNSVAEVYVGENARVRFATIHNFNEAVYDYTYRRATVERDGRMEWIIGEMNNGNTVSNNTSVLTGTGGFADSKSIFVGTGEQKTNFVSKIIHEGEHTDSNILSRGVLLDQSTAIFNGITEMKKGAAKSNAEQAEKILMLSENARGDANPILYIDEYDLMASHAASVGPVNPDDIYYLMSRGIHKYEAQKLIIHGFLEPVVSQIPIEGMREQLAQLIERKLKQ